MQNEFEKQMRQKMDELQIHPSESVWENVRDQITKPKRKRRAMIFLLALAGIFLGGYWLLNPNYQHTSINQSKNIVEKKQAITENKKMNEDNQAHPDVRVIKPNSNYNSGRKFIVSSTGPDKTSSKKLLTELSENKTNKIVDATTGINDYHDELKTATIEIDKNEIKNMNNNKDSVRSQSLTNEIKFKNDTSENSSTKHTMAPKQNHKWKLGLLFSAGISGVADNFLGVGEDKSYADRYSNSPQGTAGGVYNGSSGAIPSKTQRSGALLIGVFTEKNISKKIKFSIGINYKYFSTTSRVGERNDTTQYFRVNNFGKKYRNSFNFIELPVSLNFPLWDERKIPVLLHGGFVISQLINSNSLQYNLSSQSYYNNNSLFNKTQIGFTTGLSATLFSKQKNTLLLGPDFYFGATGLAGSGLYGKKHFSYIGLRSAIIFGKKYSPRE